MNIIKMSIVTYSAVYFLRSEIRPLALSSFALAPGKPTLFRFYAQGRRIRLWRRFLHLYSIHKSKHGHRPYFDFLQELGKISHHSLRSLSKTPRFWYFRYGKLPFPDSLTFDSLFRRKAKNRPLVCSLLFCRS